MVVDRRPAHLPVHAISRRIRSVSMTLLGGVLSALLPGILIAAWPSLRERALVAFWAVPLPVWTAIAAAVLVSLAMIARAPAGEIEDRCSQPKIAYGWQSWHVRYGGVVWRASIPLDAFGWATDSSQIDVDAWALCPECETELVQRKPRLGGGYVWSCPSCVFRSRRKDGMKAVAQLARRVARRDYEKRELSTVSTRQQ